MEMKDRISFVIEDKKIKKSDFAKRINVSPASVSQLISGVTNPSNQTIAAICREFSVREDWLRFEKGDPYYPDAGEGLAFIDDLLSEVGDDFIDTIKAIMITYSELDPDSKRVLKEFARSLSGKMKKENRD